MKRVAVDDLSARLHHLPVTWYVLSAVAGVCLLFVVAATTVCVYRCYRRRRRPSNGAMPPGVASASPDLAASPLDGHGLVVNMKHGSVQQNQRQTHGQSAEQNGDVFLGPTCTVTGDHGVVCQTKCYVVNDKEGLAVSPDTDEKEEKTTEKKSEIEADEQKTLGTLQFTVGYDVDKSALSVSIICAKNLPVKNATICTSDPYVKLQLLPEKRQKVKTRVVRKTLNPVFDETFTFYSIDVNQLSGISLHFAVLSFDRFSRDDLIGEVVYQLDAVELDSAKKSAVCVCRQIEQRHAKESAFGRGEILVSICHHPAANRLTVVILKARNLPKMDITGLADPYVKVYLTYNGQRIAKKKTHIKKRTLNPVFNESFIFDLPTTDPTSAGGSNLLAGVSLDFVVLDWDQMTKNEVVGHLEIGAGSGDAERAHWLEVVSCPRKQIASWHKLNE